jgi:two-component system nitrogen regulation sensor histidine kinase NtrY
MHELYSAYRRVAVEIPDEDVRCSCDPDQVRQVLINLMDNALAATEVSEAAVRLYCLATEDGVEFHMLDHGVGIPEEAVPQIFDAYFSTKEHGSGLGLAIARRIAEEHEGTLELVSELDPTHLCLRLPKDTHSMEQS